jgi:hypothetical protein
VVEDLCVVLRRGTRSAAGIRDGLRIPAIQRRAEVMSACSPESWRLWSCRVPPYGLRGAGRPLHSGKSRIVGRQRPVGSRAGLQVMAVPTHSPVERRIGHGVRMPGSSECLHPCERAADDECVDIRRALVGDN